MDCLEPISKIKADLGIDPNGKLQTFFTSECKRFMDRYTPLSTGGILSGMLQNNFAYGPDYIDYNSPYAHYMYQGLSYVDPDTGSSYAKKGATKVTTNTPLHYNEEPTRGAFWDSVMWSIHKDEITKEMQDFVDRGCK